MATPKFLYAFAFFTLLFSVATTCNRDVDIPPLSYNFSEKLSVETYRKSYAVGDTLWVRFQSADKTLYDLLSSTRVAYDTTYLGASFAFRKISPRDSTVVQCLPVTPGIANPQFGSSPTSGSFLSFSLPCSNPTFGFRVGFVLLQKGYFVLDPYAAVQNCPAKLQRRTVQFGWTYDVVDCNLDVFQAGSQLLTAAEKASFEQRINARQVFAFKVE